MEIALEGAQDVLYFTHDYCANSSDKNNFIQSVSRTSKKLGVSKLVAVCPIEHELFWTEDNQTPLEKRNEAQQKALQANDKLTILNSNIVFGKGEGYLVHYMNQCVMAGKINKAIGGSRGFQYKPVSSDDLTAAVEKSLTDADSVKGKSYSVNGADSMTLNDLLGHIEKSMGKSNTKLQTNLGISDLIEEFFTGIAHDKNMARMAEFLDSNLPNLEENSPDFFKQFNLTHSKKVGQFYSSTKFSEEELIHPIFTNYKMVSLD